MHTYWDYLELVINVYAFIEWITSYDSEWPCLPRHGIYLIINIKTLFHKSVVEIDWLNRANALICLAFVIIFPTEFLLRNAQADSHHIVYLAHLLAKLSTDLLFGCAAFDQIAQNFSIFSQLKSFTGHNIS